MIKTIYKYTDTNYNLVWTEIPRPIDKFNNFVILKILSFFFFD